MSQILGNILIVDDETNIRRGLRAILAKCGYTVEDAESAEDALTVLDSFACDVALVDIRLPGMSGIELLQMMRTRWPQIAVVLMTGHGTVESGLEVTQMGAYAFLHKPIQPGAICQTVDTALTASR